MAHVIEVEDKSMLATQRCDRCGAQAWVEALVNKEKSALLFCGVHFREHEEAIKAIPEAMIADHRPTLLKQESGQRDAASAAH